MNALMNLPINQTVNAPVSIRRYEPTATLLLPNHILTEDYAATEFVDRYGDNIRLPYHGIVVYLQDNALAAGRDR